MKIDLRFCNAHSWFNRAQTLHEISEKLMFVCAILQQNVIGSTFKKQLFQNVLADLRVAQSN